ncbi:ELMO domain-containing protein 1 [Phlyctochytrium planicorne]|nr:ELMO domain-containing protein 1 [Phlyctochytrium planicorne]
MHELNARAATKYDSSNKAHERKLLELWDLAMPGVKLESRISSQWGLIGFQGNDPATDFRGMGLLGLDDLHYYAKVHSASFQRVLQSSRHETAWFSMAVVGINITGFVISLVRTRQLQGYFYKFGTTKDVYEEFYCYVFDSFEKIWTQYATPLTIMDFGRVFQEFQGKIEKQLLEGYPTVLDEDSVVFLKGKKAK